jgi:TPR repeat protein
VKWYRLAAEQGYARAQSNLGVMYGIGRGIPKDDKQAVRWYRLAADQGNTIAQNNLGAKYEDGQGIEPNRVIAYALYNLSAANDSTNQEVAATNRRKLSESMSPIEIRMALELSGELAKANNFLGALDRFSQSSTGKAKAKAVVQKGQAKPS